MYHIIHSLLLLKLELVTPFCIHQISVADPGGFDKPTFLSQSSRTIDKGCGLAALTWLSQSTLEKLEVFINSQVSGHIGIFTQITVTIVFSV